jgi:hypothetical protein
MTGTNNPDSTPRVRERAWRSNLKEPYDTGKKVVDAVQQFQAGEDHDTPSQRLEADDPVTSAYDGSDGDTPVDVDEPGEHQETAPGLHDEPADRDDQHGPTRAHMLQMIRKGARKDRREDDPLDEPQKIEPNASASSAGQFADDEPPLLSGDAPKSEDEADSEMPQSEAALAKMEGTKPLLRPVVQSKSTSTPTETVTQAAARVMRGHAQEKFNFSDDFQDMLLACMVRHQMFEGGIVQPTFFNGTAAFDACYEIKEYEKKHCRFPTFTILGNLIYQRFAMRNPDRAKECVEYIKKLARIDTSDHEGVRNMVIAFARERAIQSALRVAMDASYQGEEIKGGLIKLFEDALNVGAHIDALSFADVLNYDEDNDGLSLLGDRYLCRGGSLMISAGTGIGKSVLANQMAVAWALGLPAFGIRPTGALKSLVIQAENDGGDLKKMAVGACQGMGLTADQIKIVAANVKFVTVLDATGDKLLDRVRGLLGKHKPDLLWIDPLLAYAGCGLTDQEAITKFLRNGLNPVIHQHKCGVIILHHTNKPSLGTDKREMQNNEWAYGMAGSADIANWARAIVSITGTDSPNMFRAHLGKRAQRSGIVDEFGLPAFSFLLKHSRDKLFWEVATAGDEAELASAKNREDDILKLVPLDKPIRLATLKILATQLKKPVGVNKVAGLLNILVEACELYLWQAAGKCDKWYARSPMPANWKPNT